MPKKADKTIQVTQREGLALALSGGGFRATLFHLGLLRRLNELDLLKSVDTVSSVSGGSIIAAVLANESQHWKQGRLTDEQWNQLIRDPILHITSKNIRTWPILKSALLFWKKGIAADQIEKTYFKHLNNKTLEELPDDVDFVFCATDMIFSTHWYFRKQTKSRRRTGNYRAGYLKNWKEVTIAKAVAASSCYPPIFGPMVLGKTKEDFYKPSKAIEGWSELIGKIRLTDGGVYDNLGLEPVWSQKKFLIVSDGGRPCPYSPIGRFGQLTKLPNLVQNQIESLRKRMLMERSKSQALDFHATLIQIDDNASENGYSDTFTKDVISCIRTDLDAFSNTEAKVLENHGYALACKKISTFLQEGFDPSMLDTEALTKEKIPNPEFMHENTLRTVLKKSNKRSWFYQWRAR